MDDHNDRQKDFDARLRLLVAKTVLENAKKIKM